MTCSQDGTRTRDLSAVSHQAKYQLFHLTYRKNWWTRSPSLTWVCHYHFSNFCWEISSWSNVNLFLNRTLFSFKEKEIFNKLSTSHWFFLTTKNRLTDWTPKNDSSFRPASNRRHQRYKGCTLPTELRKPVYIITSATLGELPFPRCLSV